MFETFNGEIVTKYSLFFVLAGHALIFCHFSENYWLKTEGRKYLPRILQNVSATQQHILFFVGTRRECVYRYVYRPVGIPVCGQNKKRGQQNTPFNKNGKFHKRLKAIKAYSINQ